MNRPPCFDIANFSPITISDDKVGLEAAWLRLAELPLEKDLRSKLVNILHAIHARVETITRQQILYDVYIQMAQLERPSGALLISKNASRWTPRIGLGVWPDREPPQPLSKEDFFNTPPDQKMRQTSFHVMRIDDQENTISLEVINEIAGTGALLVAMVEKDGNPGYGKNISSHLEAYMTAENFRGFPMYFPLLNAVSLEKMSREDLDACLPGIVLYIREDVTESAALIVSRIPLEKLFSGIYFGAADIPSIEPS
jgi:hypothetical protein